MSKGILVNLRLTLYDALFKLRIWFLDVKRRRSDRRIQRYIHRVKQEHTSPPCK